MFLQNILDILQTRIHCIFVLQILELLPSKKIVLSCAWFMRKTFLRLYSINWPNLLFEISDNIFIETVCVPVSDVINFETYRRFLIKPFYYITKNIRTKIEIPYEQKELLRWNKMHYSSFLKDVQVPEIVSDLRVWL